MSASSNNLHTLKTTCWDFRRNNLVSEIIWSAKPMEIKDLVQKQKYQQSNFLYDKLIKINYFTNWEHKVIVSWRIQVHLFLILFTLSLVTSSAHCLGSHPCQNKDRQREGIPQQHWESPTPQKSLQVPAGHFCPSSQGCKGSGTAASKKGWG